MADIAITWSARLAGSTVAAFLALFAFSAFTGHSGHGFAQTILHFAIHLVPALIAAAVVFASWRRPAAGVIGFFALAGAYAVIARNRLDWIAVISGPLAAVAVLHLVALLRMKRRAVLAGLGLFALALPADAQRPETPMTPPVKACRTPARLPECSSFVQLDGGFAIQLFSAGSVLLDSTRASSSDGPHHAQPLPVRNLPEYVSMDITAMRNTDANHALGVTLHSGLMLGFTTLGGSDFLYRTAVSVKRRTWLEGDDYRDISAGVLLAQVERLRHPSGPAPRPGITASVTWGRKKVAAFASADVVAADIEPRVALHGGIRISGAKPVLAATAIGAALIGFFNMPL